MDSIYFPDISVLREQLTDRREWARYADPTGAFVEWGIWALRRGDVPLRMVHEANRTIEFKTRHTPKPWNYPHTAIQAWEDREHISQGSDKQVPPLIEYRFCQQIYLSLKMLLKPGEDLDTDEEEVFTDDP